jgi:drug/metabolite transporter (DMT)-like permease
VVAVALGWAVLDEPVTPRMLSAGAIIVGAVVLIANGHRTESVETTSRLEAGS